MKSEVVLTPESFMQATHTRIQAILKVNLETPFMLEAENLIFLVGQITALTLLFLGGEGTSKLLPFSSEDDDINFFLHLGFLVSRDSSWSLTSLGSTATLDFDRASLYVSNK